jgi:hypothetical protein
MKVKLEFYRLGIGLSVEHGPDEMLIRAKKMDYSEQRRLKKLIGKLEGGHVYWGCNFGNPYRVDVPVPIQPIRGTDEGAIERASTMTGIPKEMIERVWQAIKEYYTDLNKPQQGG